MNTDCGGSAASKFVFVGVSTRSSAVTEYFPAWCEILGVRWGLAHYDLPINADSRSYQVLAQQLRHEGVVGALVTTHKAKLFEASWQSFDLIEPLAIALREVGVVFKRGDEMCIGVSDVKAGEVILNELLETECWQAGDREAYVIGAGGAGLAAVWNLAVRGVGKSQRVVVIEQDPARRAASERLLGDLKTSCPVEVVTPVNGIADTAISGTSNAPLVINASGLGKDRPGNPISGDFLFPSKSIVWDFNYRGELEFLRQAQAQSNSRRLTVSDGFRYFACGWSVVMSRVSGRQWSTDIFNSFKAVTHSS